MVRTPRAITFKIALSPGKTHKNNGFGVCFTPSAILRRYLCGIESGPEQCCIPRSVFIYQDITPLMKAASYGEMICVYSYSTEQRFCNSRKPSFVFNNFVGTLPAASGSRGLGRNQSLRQISHLYSSAQM